MERKRGGGLSGLVEILSFFVVVCAFCAFWCERRVSRVPWCL